MNAYQQPQSSGIHWPDPTPGLLYQPFQAAPRWREPNKALLFSRAWRANGGMLRSARRPAESEVRRHYVLPADSSVITFLTEHLTLPSILLEAAPQLKACFGSQAVFTLRAPIDDSGSQTLYAVVIWPGKVREVREALEKFDDTWWIQHSRKASGDLSFTYELV